ncbi:MAG: NAD(P)-binding domain-containing protein [Cyanobacteria bacterium J06621_11]
MVYQRIKSPDIAVGRKSVKPRKQSNLKQNTLDPTVSRQIRTGQGERLQKLSERYDPFGVNQAMLTAIKGPPRWRSIGAKAVSWSVLFTALLPLPLTIFSIFVVSVVTALPANVPLWSNTLFWLTVSSWIFLLWVSLFTVDQLRQLFFDYSDDSMRPTADNPGRRGSVIVIGAGPVGLATVKECLAEGLSVQCFERQCGVGGVFRFNRDFPGGCWPTVKLTTSPWVTAYSDFPPERSSFTHSSAHSSTHYSAQQYAEYLERYVERFELGQSLNFSQSVTSVQRTDNGQWCVRTLDEKTGKCATHYCDRVAVCAGLNLTPKPIDLPGQETFTGEVRHSSRYVGTDGLEGKRVVVVGAGESGVDIATELSHVARETYLSLRSGKFVIPRTNPLNGVANDYDTNRIRYALPVPLRNGFMTFERKLCFHTGEHTPEAAFRAQLLATSKAGPSSQTVTKSDDFIHRVIADQLCLRKNVVGFDQETVVFADGLRQPADVVIFSHGYIPAFPFLRYPDQISARHPGDMFLNMFHPELGDSIAFCGFARPAIGAIPPTGEIQARLFAQVAAGNRVLPDHTRMLQSIDDAKRENSASFPTQPQPNAVVNWIPYMDKVARLIDCKPQPLRLWRQPKLVWRLCTGPMTGAYYRLQGPGKSAIALNTINTLPRMHRIREILIYLGLHFWSWPLQVLHPHARWRRLTSIV